MLTAPQPSPPEQKPDAHPLRLCTICGDLDAVVRVAAYIAERPATAARLDLDLTEALDRLRTLADEVFERIVIAPADRQEVAPRLMQALVTAALDRAAMVVLLLPPGPAPDLALPEATAADRLHVLQGPPFHTQAVQKTPRTAAAPSRRPRFLPWRRRAPPSQPPPGIAYLTAPLRVLAVQPFGGGVGGTTLSVNLAVECARAGARTCLLDLNPQSGNVATYLHLPGDMRVTDAYRNLAALDGDAFQSCLHPVEDRLSVFPAPQEMLPLDALTPADATRLVGLARASADLVLLDLPHVVSDWSGAVFALAERILAICRLDVRSAQNGRKLIGLLRAEGLPTERILPVLNAAPSRRDRDWHEARTGFEAGLGTAFGPVLPDGGPGVARACDLGLPLARHDPANPLRQALRNLAGDLLGRDTPTAAPMGRSGTQLLPAGEG